MTLTLLTLFGTHNRTGGIAMKDARKVPFDDRTQDDPATDRGRRLPAPRGSEPLGNRDEAPPGTPGTGENIDPKTGERFIEGIGGA